MTEHALVTGAAKRIGRSLALHLSKQGYALTIHYNTSKQEADEVVREIENTGGQAVAIKADLSDMDDVRNLEKNAAEALGPVTLLVNNASTFENDEVGTITTETWDHHLKPNLQAPIFLSQAMAARLPTDRKGLIINLIDQRVWALTPRFMSYTLSKAALWSATQTLAQALAPNIRVNGIGPGPTLSNSRQSSEDFQNQVDATILKVQPQLEEIAAAIDFIRNAPSMTGQMIALDSGQHLAWETPDVVGSFE
ncbi:MAG: SDR family oxidoreductase [Hyphomicrobiales bacterium]|uniref:SDR family oxidoreductase n=1 Tax=Nisaea sp. TaxID=2024842 RepID=UPI003269B2EB